MNRFRRSEFPTSCDRSGARGKSSHKRALSDGGCRDCVVEDRTFLMRYRDNFRVARRWAFQTAVLFAVFALVLGAGGALGSASHVPARGVVRPVAGSDRSPAARPVSASYSQVKNYFLDFAGDHSVNGATVIEQTTAGYANYTVQIQLASGAEQSVSVAAPPGGLQIEMHDMTGDHVPNDVVLRPALLLWPPTVLVNDGHDHFAVVVSGVDPGALSSRENFGSRPRDNQTFALLRSSGFKAIHLPPNKRMLAPQLQQTLWSAFRQSFAWGIEHASSSDRAPPFVTTI